MDKVLQERLQKLLDRDEIWRVLQRYARGVDRVDRDLLRSCYHPGAIDDHGHYLGDVEGFMSYAHGTVVGLKSTTHHITTCNIELDGDDAHTETSYIYFGTAAEPPHLVSSGRYVDHFQRRHGEWRIANRVCVIEGTYEIFDNRLSAALPCGGVQRQPDQARPPQRPQRSLGAAVEGGDRLRHDHLPAYWRGQRLAAPIDGIADRGQYRHHADGGRVRRRRLAQPGGAAPLSGHEDCLVGKRHRLDTVPDGARGLQPRTTPRLDAFRQLFRRDEAERGFRRHFTSCFIDDAYGLRNLDLIGEDNVCYEVDYPHSDTPWPNAPEVLWPSIKHLTTEQIDKITHLNAMRTFKFDPFAGRGKAHLTVKALREKARADGVDTSIKSQGGAAPLASGERARPVTSGDIVKMLDRHAEPA